MGGMGELGCHYLHSPNLLLLPSVHRYGADKAMHGLHSLRSRDTVTQISSPDVYAETSVNPRALQADKHGEAERAILEK